MQAWVVHAAICTHMHLENPLKIFKAQVRKSTEDLKRYGH